MSYNAGYQPLISGTSTYGEPRNYASYDQPRQIYPGESKPITLKLDDELDDKIGCCQQGWLGAWWNPQPYRGVEKGYLRAFNITYAPLGVLNTIVKLFATIVSFVPGSSSEWVKENMINIDKLANEGLEKKFNMQHVLPRLFLASAVTINPYAQMEDKISKTNCWVNGIFREATEQALAGFQYNECYGKGQRMNDSGVKEWLQRNVVSRILFATWTVAVVAEKIVHLALSVIYTVCAAAKLFRDKEANDIAREYLGALDLFDEFCVGVRATLYPWQNLGKDRDLSAYRDPKACPAVLKAKVDFMEELHNGE